MQEPTVDQLRDRIDRGLTGEKVAMPDPAAAPLGTDAEAAGMPPTPQELALAAQQAPRRRPRPASLPAVPVYLGLVLVVGVTAITIVSQALS